MRIISWNVNGIRAAAKKGLPEFVWRRKPDALCLQETKANKDQVEPSVLEKLPPFQYWSSAKRKGYSGVATFLHHEMAHVEYGIGIEEFDTEGRFVITRHPSFDLYNIYFPNGGSGEERHEFKQSFLRKLLAHLKKEIKGGRELIVVGDYNIAHRNIDVYDPARLHNQSGFLPEEREWFDHFLDAGFVDTFRHVHPDLPHKYTWWDYRQMARVGNRGWRIDYICVTKGLVSRIEHAEILDQVEGSDHCPVLLDIKD